MERFERRRDRLRAQGLMLADPKLQALERAEKEARVLHQELLELRDKLQLTEEARDALA